MEIEEHGGACCGIKHLYGFGDTLPTESNKERVLYLIRQGQYVDEEDNYNEGVIAIEVILGSSQLGRWGDYLNSLGFVEVCSWTNINTENHLTMLVLTEML